MAVFPRYRQAPAYTDIIFPVTSFAGGLNTKSSLLFLSTDDPYALRPDQLTVADNVLRNTSGQLETRPGRTLLNASPLAPPAGNAIVRDLFELRKSNGTKIILAHAGNTIYAWNGSAFVSIGTVVTANTRIHWCQFKDVAIAFDGTNAPFKTDGATLTALTGSPPTAATICISYRSRVWALAGQTVYYCALSNEMDWTTVNNAGSLAIPTARGGAATGAAAFWTSLVIFTSHEVFQITGSSPALLTMTAVNLIHGHTGTPYAVVEAGNEVYYCNEKGIHSLSVTVAQSELGDVAYGYESYIIEPSWQALTAGNLSNVVAINDRMRNLVLYLCSPTLTTNSEAYVGDYYHKDAQQNMTWTHYSNCPFSSATEVVSLNSGIPEILFGDYSGNVYWQRQTAVDDAGSIIPVQWQYVTDAGNPAWEKTWRHCVLYTYAVSGVMTGSFSFDFGASIRAVSLDLAQATGSKIGSTFRMGVSTLGAVGLSAHQINIPAHGRWLTMSVSVASPQRLKFGGMVFYAGLRRILGGQL